MNPNIVKGLNVASFAAMIGTYALCFTGQILTPPWAVSAYHTVATPTSGVLYCAIAVGAGAGAWVLRQLLVPRSDRMNATALYFASGCALAVAWLVVFALDTLASAIGAACLLLAVCVCAINVYYRQNSWLQRRRSVHLVVDAFASAAVTFSLFEAGVGVVQAMTAGGASGALPAEIAFALPHIPCGVATLVAVLNRYDPAMPLASAACVLLQTHLGFTIVMCVLYACCGAYALTRTVRSAC